jgi:hypothetical protein
LVSITGHFSDGGASALSARQNISEISHEA